MGAAAAMRVVLASELPGASGGLATAAAIGIAFTAASPVPGALLIEVEEGTGRGPTMLASASARELEDRLRAGGVEAAARGRLCWARIGDPDWRAPLAAALDIAAPAGLVIARLRPHAWREAVEERLGTSAVLHAELPRQRALAALAVREGAQAGVRVRVSWVAPGRVGTRRALAGIEPSGEAGRRAARLARALAPAAERAGARTRSPSESVGAHA